nr:immunoglobulin light chain junction region [Macaca mulatta]MOX47819.1 immunoglobulin light chain junction region [Macaca mulatta]MOX48118.1 immunoglobulin light chain junction region [Macaca mulatta]MOX49061.1 immunoglobulin light chain junction region [Macaca mulatta]MOX49539.1 immunoglobulin light chain junction region [Macaca mulatta]
CFQYYSGFTF